MQMQSYLDHPSHGPGAAPGHLAEVDRLTPHHLAHLARILHDDLEQLHERLAHHDEVFGRLVTDASVDGIERQAARRAVEEDLLSIEATNRAIASIDDGSYGICAACGRVIPFERLEALPATRACVACPDI